MVRWYVEIHDLVEFCILLIKIKFLSSLITKYIFYHVALVVVLPFLFIWLYVGCKRDHIAYLCMALITLYTMNFILMNTWLNWCNISYCEKALILLVRTQIIFQILMFKYAFMSCRLHVHHVFGGMPILVWRGQVKLWIMFWFWSFILMCFYHFWMFHWILGRGLSHNLEKVA